VTPSSFRPFLERQGFLVLDGGLATTLEAAGHELDGELWSARLVLQVPEAVRRAHSAFLEAGADCITSAGYQASLDGFARAGLTSGAAEAALHRAVEFATEARDAFWSRPRHRVGRMRPLVAASAGPYGAFLADGSEYHGRYGVGRDVLDRFHRRRLEILAVSGADVLALETIPSLAEVEALVALLARLEHPGAWLSLTCRDGERLRDGSPIEDAVSLCSPEAGLAGVGVNCTHPGDVEDLVRRIHSATDLPILAYPNSGETYDAASGSWLGRPAGAEWLDYVSGWVDAGARIIGGCCRVGPDTIRGLRARLGLSVPSPGSTLF
jgi:homocysteine S-methyltransferase